MDQNPPALRIAGRISDMVTKSASSVRIVRDFWSTHVFRYWWKSFVGSDVRTFASSSIASSSPPSAPNTTSKCLHFGSVHAASIFSPFSDVPRIRSYPPSKLESSNALRSEGARRTSYPQYMFSFKHGAVRETALPSGHSLFFDFGSISPM